jgi:hypothetical protein
MEKTSQGLIFPLLLRSKLKTFFKPQTLKAPQYILEPCPDFIQPFPYSLFILVQEYHDDRILQALFRETDTMRLKKVSGREQAVLSEFAELQELSEFGGLLGLSK